MSCGKGKILLKYAVLANIRVFKIIALLMSDNSLGDSLCMWFCIFVRVNCQFINVACFKPSQNNIPKFFIVSYCSFIVMCGKRSCKSVIWSVLIGSILAFSTFTVAPDALFSFWKKDITFSADFCSFIGKSEPSAYFEVLLVLRNWEFLFLLWCRRDLYWL